MDFDLVFAAQKTIPREIFDRPEVAAIGAGLSDETRSDSPPAVHLYLRPPAEKRATERTDLVDALKRHCGDIPVVTFDAGPFVKPVDPEAVKGSAREVVGAHQQMRPMVTPFPVASGHSVGSIRPALSGGYNAYETGTVGLIVKPAGKVIACYLSCSSILGPSLTNDKSFIHLSPAPLDGGVNLGNRIGVLKNWMLIGEGSGHDSAVGIIDSTGTFDPTYPDGGIINGYGNPRVGDSIMKYGRATGLTKGKVKTINTDVKVYRQGLNREFTFVGQAITYDGAGGLKTVRLPGDDGAVWITTANRTAVLQDIGSTDTTGRFGVATGITVVMLIHRLNQAQIFNSEVGEVVDERPGAAPMPTEEQLRRWRGEDIVPMQ